MRPSLPAACSFACRLLSLFSRLVYIPRIVSRVFCIAPSPYCVCCYLCCYLYSAIALLSVYQQYTENLLHPVFPPSPLLKVPPMVPLMVSPWYAKAEA